MNMKSILALILLTPLFSIGQNNEIPLKDGELNYSEVVVLDSTFKKNDLYINAKKFFVDVYHSAKDVIQLDDKDAGIVIGKGYFETLWKANFLYTYQLQIWHTIKISIKDGKYKYEITDFRYKYYVAPDKYSSGGWNEGNLKDWKKVHNGEKSIQEAILKEEAEISQLKTYMSKRSSTADF